PVEVQPRVLLPAGRDVAVADDPTGRDLPAPHQLADQPRRGVVLRRRVRLPAVVAQAHPDTVVVAVAPALPRRLARVPGPLLVRDQPVDPAVAPDEVVVRHTGAGIAAPGEIARVRLSGGAVDDDQVRPHAGRAGVVVGRRRLDDLHASPHDLPADDGRDGRAGDPGPRYPAPLGLGRRQDEI